MSKSHLEKKKSSEHTHNVRCFYCGAGFESKSGKTNQLCPKCAKRVKPGRKVNYDDPFAQFESKSSYLIRNKSEQQESSEEWRNFKTGDMVVVVKPVDDEDRKYLHQAFRFERYSKPHGYAVLKKSASSFGLVYLHPEALQLAKAYAGSKADRMKREDVSNLTYLIRNEAAHTATSFVRKKFGGPKNTLAIRLTVNKMLDDWKANWHKPEASSARAKKIVTLVKKYPWARESIPWDMWDMLVAAVKGKKESYLIRIEAKMDANRLEHLSSRIESVAMTLIEKELNTTATDELSVRDLAPWRAATRMLLRKVSELADAEAKRSQP